MADPFLFEQSETIIENDNYSVTFTNFGYTDVTVVFSSAGALAIAQPIEEFKKTISNFRTSYIFFQSKHLDWYNNKHATKTFRQVGLFCSRFERVFATGESLGGSGAMVFADFCDNITRVLAFSAQYSALPEFCKWHGPISPLDGIIPQFMFSNYASSKALTKAVLIYPASSYEDNLHSKCFQAEGFNVVHVKSNEHAIASWLKKSPNGNLLIPVLAAMYNREFEFAKKPIEDLLGDLAQRSHKPFTRWIGDKTFPWQDYIDEPAGQNIAAGKVATQSSTCIYSYSSDRVVEATRALNEEVGSLPNCHTEFEKNPWWMVDLGDVYRINDILIFNRSDLGHFTERFSQFSVLSSIDGVTWREVYTKSDTSIVGGLYGKPCLINTKITAHLVKIILNNTDYLHLSKVCIYGELLEPVSTGMEVSSPASHEVIENLT